MAIGILQTIRTRSRSYFSSPKPRGSAATHRGQRAENRTDVATGIIESIRDSGVGFITRDRKSNRPDLFFHRSAVMDEGFDQLRAGQVVRFSEERDPHNHNRQRAIGVRPVARVEGAKRGEMPLPPTNAEST